MCGDPTVQRRVAETPLESAQIVCERADAMTIPVEDAHSASDWLFAVVDELRKLPHVEKLTEITALWNALFEQKKQKLWPVQEDLGLQSLKNDSPLNARRLAAKWKKSRVRLLFEPSTCAEDLLHTFKDIRKHFDQLQVSSKQIVQQLDKVIEDLDDGGARNELKSAEADFKKQFFQFLHEKRSNPVTSEDPISVSTWLGQLLGIDAGSIKQELEEVDEKEGSVLATLLLYIAELEEDRKKRASSDANFEDRIFDKPVDEVSHSAAQALGFDKPLNEVARKAVKALGSAHMSWVLTGFEDLTRCSKSLEGKLEVYKANAIPEAIRLAQEEEGLYTNVAMTLLEALTSSLAAGEDSMRSSEYREIFLHTSVHLDFLIDLMKNKSDFKSRLLAAETVVNLLVNSQVWTTVRIKYDIVSALVAIADEDMVDQTIHDWNRADRVCLVGLSHLEEFKSRRIELEEKSANGKTQIIVTAMLRLLSDGLKETVLRNLAKDTLVALDRVMDRQTPTLEIWLEVRKELLNLMVTGDLISHSTIPGRVAIMSLLKKLCGDREGITAEGLFLYLLKIMKRTGSEIVQLPKSVENDQKVKDLKQILDLAVKLLCLCVTHGKDTAQAVLSQNVEERKSLEAILEEPNSGGILDESKLHILEIFDKIDMPRSNQGPTSAGKLAVLVKMAKSPSPGCRAQVASRLLKFVKEKLDETEMEEAGGIDALMNLLKGREVDCQNDALLALHLLSPRIKIQIAKDLPFGIILDFLHPDWPSDIRDAAVGFLDLMVKNGEAKAKKFVETPAALKAVLSCLDAENPSCQKSASAVLVMATEEDDDVRFAIDDAGLKILVKFVQAHGSIEHRKLLTIMLGLLCKSGTECEESVTRASGHSFLLTSLQEKISMVAAAQGLLSLLGNARTRGDVLQAGFVEIAMGSIDRENASAEMALGLASVCSTPDGLDQIFACSRSVGSLLVLIERCPTLGGKGAAAAVIAKLYPLLNSNEYLGRQGEMLYACSLLIKYLDHEDRSQQQEFLKALAAFATGKKGLQTIHEERGERPLIRFLKDKEIDTQVRDLVLQILAEMSSVSPDGLRHTIVYVFLDNRIGVLLCDLLRNAEFKENTESMKNLLILIRNISLTGPIPRNHLSDSGAVTLLLSVISDHGSSLPRVIEFALKALMTFMDDPNCKYALLDGGIEYLVSILKLADKSPDVRNLTTIILASVAQDARTRGAACTAIFNCDILQSLTYIMFSGETTKTKWQAAVLMKLLARNGPTKQVCAAVLNAGILDALIELRTQQYCEEIANDVLKFLRGKNADCKKYIDERLTNPSLLYKKKPSTLRA